MKFKHISLVAISGLLWLAIGTMLLSKGVRLLFSAMTDSQGMPLLDPLSKLTGSREQSAIWIVLLALTIGYFKGRFVLLKSFHRIVARIQELPNPSSLFNIYSRGYCLLLGSMVFLGLLMNFLNLSGDIRGLIDLAIGSALINGAMPFFRKAVELRNYTSEK